MPRAELVRGERGQILILTALMLTVLLGFAGIAIDIAWYHLNTLRIQRAADAAALAGVVYLPGNPTGAVTAARNEATKNGYTAGVNGTTVTAAQDAINNRLLAVTIRGTTQTFFARFFGMDTFRAERRARAEFILPVPMGSPQDYFGIYQLCTSSGSCSIVADAANPAVPLASQGFWGAVITRGGQRSNGDAYSPQFNGGATANANFDPNGYSYSVELPPGTTNGEVWLFDAPFCAVGRSTGGSYLGTGDHWIGTGGTPVTTDFRLWDTGGTPYSTTDDVWIAETGSLFANQNKVDKGLLFRGNQQYSDGGYNGSGSLDCQGDPNHNAWYRLASGLGAGLYRLQVTTSALGNTGTSAENMFGIQVKSNGAPGARVYGTSRMVAYANVNSGSSLFYLAQVAAVHAGKTLEIKLFDPGDVGGNAFLRIKRPTSTGYVNATFSWTATNGQSGNNVTSLTTASGGSSLFQNHWVTVSIPLQSNYGVGGLTPPGETEPGWWKIEYQITAAGNDTTTWEVNIRGNPVHLVTP